MTNRTEILNWVNDLLSLNYTRIEQLGSGAAYCQILDTIYHDVPLHKIKFESILEYEMLSNYKVLQNVFNVHHIQKPVPVEKLIRCKFQDNYEFTSWLKKFWELHPPQDEIYNAVERRKVCQVGNMIVNSPKINSIRSRSHSRTGSPMENRPRSGSMPARPRSKTVGSRPSSRPVSPHHESNLKLQGTLESLEKERNFYYEKLRSIESILQANENDVNYGPFVKQLQAILYHLEDGFEIPKTASMDETF